MFVYIFVLFFNLFFSPYLRIWMKSLLLLIWIVDVMLWISLAMIIIRSIL